jgi:hypothetical protein
LGLEEPPRLARHLLYPSAGGDAMNNDELDTKRRTGGRTHVSHLRATLSTPDHKETWIVNVSDVSLGGARLRGDTRMPVRFPIGTECTLVLFTNSEAPQITSMPSRVVRCTSDGLGIEWAFDDNDQALERLCEVMIPGA